MRGYVLYYFDRCGGKEFLYKPWRKRFNDNQQSKKCN